MFPWIQAQVISGLVLLSRLNLKYNYMPCKHLLERGICPSGGRGGGGYQSMSPPLLKFLLFIYFSQRTYLVSICMLCPHLPKTRIHPSRGPRGEEGEGGKSIPPPPSFFYLFFLPKEHIFLSICMPCTHLLKTGIYPSEGEGAQEHLFFPPPQVSFIHFFLSKEHIFY